MQHATRTTHLSARHLCKMRLICRNKAQLEDNTNCGPTPATGYWAVAKLKACYECYICIYVCMYEADVEAEVIHLLRHCADCWCSGVLFVVGAWSPYKYNIYIPKYIYASVEIRYARAHILLDKNNDENKSDNNLKKKCKQRRNTDDVLGIDARLVLLL